jgi:cytochrome c oxidase subunit 2
MPVFDPNSPQAKPISDLFIITLLIAGGIVLMVIVLVCYSAFKFRQRSGQTGEPKQIHGNRKWEIGWTAAPALLLAGLAVPTFMVMNAADPGRPNNTDVPQKQNPVNVEIIGHQFWWEYRYPGSNVVTSYELHLPVGQKYLASLGAADVIHDFWVPQLGRKMDAVPGLSNSLWLESDRLGAFYGACSEYCGDQHAWMLIRVLVEPENKFRQWLQAQQQVPAPPTDPTLKHGQQIFLQNSCADCHTIAGTSANGNVGPNLTHLASRPALGSGVIFYSRQNLYDWIKNVQKIKPGAKMPSYDLIREPDLQDLVSYLDSLK